MIFTFYSYKGGVGRTMALANIAELFYRSGLKVLMVDWDLEAPGLERFFRQPGNILDKDGIINMLLNYKEQMATGLYVSENKELPFIKPDNYAIDIYPNSRLGKLWLLTPGKRDKENFSEYVNSVLTFDWANFYNNWKGEFYIEWLRQEFEEMADVVLVDSRTGITEMGGVCTYNLADVVILFCGANDQNIDGTLQMVESFSNPKTLELRNNRKLKSIVVPSRIEGFDLTILNIFRKKFIEYFTPYIPYELKKKKESFFENLEIPYEPSYAFNEMIAVNQTKGNLYSSKLTESYNELFDIIIEFIPGIKEFQLKKSVKSEQKEVINFEQGCFVATGRRSIQPTVVIGLGGTGVKTILYLKKKLLEQAPEAIERNFVRFLAIDIDELKGEAPFVHLFEQNTRLDPGKNEFLRITDSTHGSEAKNISEISDWFPEQAYKYLPLTEGARQAKPVGRLGFFLAHDEISQWLNRLTNRLVTPEIIREFPGIKAGELNIYIASSLCGGTGAGLFLDVAYELRYFMQQALLPDKTRIKGLFALGDVYDLVSKRVFANTYASLREMNYTQRENASYHPVYPGSVKRDVIKERAFDAIYLFGDKNGQQIQFDSPDDFAQLCAEFILLDSGSDIQKEGYPLSSMLQSARNNSEVYTMNYDADGSPRCYSSLGLCKISFPSVRVSELCATLMSQTIIDHHIIGRLEHEEILEAHRKVQDFLTNEGLGCTDDNKDLPDRLAEKHEQGGERTSFDTWITKNLAKAYNSDLEGIGDLEISRINRIAQTLNDEINKLQKDVPDIVIGELQTFQRLIQQEIKRMFQENLGVNFVARFLEEMLERARQSRDFAQQEMKNFLGHEKRLSDKMNSQIREMSNLLEKTFFSFFKGEARRAQLKDTYKDIRHHFINRVNILKMQAAVNFYDGVYDARQKLLEGGEGAITLLSNMSNNISQIQAFVANLSKSFGEAYENNKKIKESPFEILIYDNDKFSTLNEIYEEIYNDTLRTTLFNNILEKMGGSIWNIQDYMNDSTELRNLFMKICKVPFEESINRKTVAQRIIDARRSITNPIDYAPKLRSAYGISDYFCRLDNGASRFADLRNSEQSIICIVSYQDEEDASWKEIKNILQETIGREGRRVPFSHSSDRHSILIYREFCGFPAYTLRTIQKYHNNYVAEANRENTPPLQMLTREPLEHINVPTGPVLSKFDVMTIEALALGVIISDEDNYYMVTPDEWKRRRLAEKAQASGRDTSIEDRTAGIDRKMGSRFNEVVSWMSQKMPESARLSSNKVFWMDQVQDQIEKRKNALWDLDQNLLCDLYESVYFENFPGTSAEKINLETEIRPSIAFILKRDFALSEKHIFRPKKTHQELLYDIYIGSVKKEIKE
ncbi:MAG: hypothetical protein GY749_16280 [Desulfobacteraceae bacterium]|nr:hypothetical protein [Desulfobacteraceae bacterium]